MTTPTGNEQRVRRRYAGAMAFVLVLALLLASQVDAALGGPVILGGDDLVCHGSVTGTTLNSGWLYIRKALENIKANVTRADDGTVAVLRAATATARGSKPRRG